MTFAAIAEAATGLALLLLPVFVVQLLLGQELSGITVPVARVAGMALIGLGVACWPGPPILGMITYSAMITLYLAFLGVSGVSGVLLWPAVGVHLVLLVLLGRVWFGEGLREP